MLVLKYGKWGRLEKERKKRYKTKMPRTVNLYIDNNVTYNAIEGGKLSNKKKMKKGLLLFQI